MQGRLNDNCCTAFPSREELEQCQNINPKHTFQSSYPIIYLHRGISILFSLHTLILTLKQFLEFNSWLQGILPTCLNNIYCLVHIISYNIYSIIYSLQSILYSIYHILHWGILKYPVPRDTWPKYEKISRNNMAKIFYQKGKLL